MLWGRLETTLVDTMLRIIHHPLATFPPPADMPAEFKRRIALWKTISKTKPLVKHQKTAALRFRYPLSTSVGRASNARAGR